MHHFDILMTNLIYLFSFSVEVIVEKAEKTDIPDIDKKKLVILMLLIVEVLFQC